MAAKKTNFNDLICCSPCRPAYSFKCSLITGARDKTPVNHSGACLSGFGSRIINNKTKKTIRYVWPVAAIERRWNTAKIKSVLGEKVITLEIVRPILLKFYHLCRDHGMLPKDFRIPKTTNNFYIKNIHDVPPSLLYAYIAHLRDVDEEPYFVYNLLTLVENYGLNPWTAYVVASGLSIVNCGHHPLPISGNIGLGGRIRATSMFNLRDYFADPYKKDKRTLLDTSTKNSYFSWNAHKHLDTSKYYHEPSEKNAWFVTKDILTNVKRFNKALGMEKKEGMAFLTRNRSNKITGDLRRHLTSLGWGVTSDFYEPWWIIVRLQTKSGGLKLVEQIKPYIEAYLLKKENYGSSWNLKLRAKTRYIDTSSKTKRRNFRQSKKASRYDNLDGVMKP